jgi:hypothetical protein
LGNRALVRRRRRYGGTDLMHLKAEYQGILAPVTYQSTTPGKLERWLEENPQANPKEVKQVKRRIRLAKEEEAE